MMGFAVLTTIVSFKVLKTFLSGDIFVGECSFCGARITDTLTNTHQCHQVPLSGFIIAVQINQLC